MPGEWWLNLWTITTPCVCTAPSVKSHNNSFNAEWWASHDHAVGFEQPLQSIYLFGGVAFLNRLLARRQVFEFGQHLKELLDFARRLVGIDDPGWDAPPRVLHVPWDEHGFTSSEAEPLLAN